MYNISVLCNYSHYFHCLFINLHYLKYSFDLLIHNKNNNYTPANGTFFVLFKPQNSTFLTHSSMTTWHIDYTTLSLDTIKALFNCRFLNSYFSDRSLFVWNNIDFSLMSSHNKFIRQIISAWNLHHLCWIL